MAAIGAVLTMLLVGVGWAQAGLMGSVTAFVAGVAVQSGLHIGFSGKDSGSAEGERASPIQSIGGILGAVLAGVGAFYGGWQWGWAWAIGGFFCGAAGALILFLLMPRGAWMLGRNNISRLEERLLPQMRSTEIDELAYLDTQGSLLGEGLVYRALPYDSFDDLFEQVSAGVVLVRVLPPVAYHIGANCASGLWRIVIHGSALLSFVAPVAAVVLAIALLDARYAIGVLGIVGMFFASPYNRGRGGWLGLSVAGVVAGFMFLGAPWGWVISLAIAPLVLTMLYKSLEMLIANEAAMRSPILLKSLAEDGHVFLADAQRGESYRPKVHEEAQAATV
jgi:hypothetical protein